jgi:hypothetical protein
VVLPALLWVGENPGFEGNTVFLGIYGYIMAYLGNTGYF